MTTMIETVAVALEPKCRAFGKGDIPMQIARELAHTAIEAMVNPSIRMIIAGGECGDFHDGDGALIGHIYYEYCREQARIVYQAMIDEALK